MVPPNVRFALFAPLAVFLLAWGSPSTSPPSTSAPSVGAAGNFAVLAGTAVTCTNGTVTGNVGVSPGTAITQTSCPVTGTINSGNAAAVQANSDFFIAYDKFKALACDRTLSTFDSQTLSPGVYCVDAAATFTDAVLTLAGNGPWIFKVGTLGTGALTGTRFSVVSLLVGQPSRDDDGFEVPRNDSRGCRHQHDPRNLQRRCVREIRGDDHGHRGHCLRDRQRFSAGLQA